MTLTYEIVVPGNSVAWSGGYLGFANLTLVSDPDGVVLFDVGHYVNRGALVRALARRGLDPQDVDRVFLSHCHFDHVTNVDLFPRARVFMGAADWEYTSDPAEADDYVPWLLREQLLRHNLELLDGDTVIAAGIRALALPGHTPGSMGLSLDLEHGTTVLAGDALNHPSDALLAERSDHDRRFPVGDTREHDRASVARILSVADRIVPGHFVELVNTPTGCSPLLRSRWIWSSVAERSRRVGQYP